DLAAWCAGGDRVERALAALPAILDALAFLHGAGIVHCDLKPSNVLVGSGGHVTLLDFGLLARLGAEPSPGGTPSYAAPEQWRGEKATAASDAYALGATLHHVLTGRPRAREARDGPPSWPLPSSIDPAIPLALDEVCMALLRPEPTHRPSLGWVAARLGLDATFARRARPLTLVGRDDVLGVLRAALDAPGGDVVALVGPTGVGKSAVADAV